MAYLATVQNGIGLLPLTFVGIASNKNGYEMIDPDDTGDIAVDTGRRLKLTREALRIEDQRDFGEPAGISQSLYNRFETGSRRITLEAALKLCHHYDLTLDWIYRGDPSGLPYRLADDIRAQRKLK